MGLRPEGINYLRMAGEFLGNLDASAVIQRAESITRFRTPFAVLPQFSELRT
jgi:hypothetical protein